MARRPFPPEPGSPMDGMNGDSTPMGFGGYPRGFPDMQQAPGPRQPGPPGPGPQGPGGPMGPGGMQGGPMGPNAMRGGGMPPGGMQGGMPQGPMQQGAMPSQGGMGKGGMPPQGGMGPPQGGMGPPQGGKGGMQPGGMRPGGMPQNGMGPTMGGRQMPLLPGANAVPVAPLPGNMMKDGSGPGGMQPASMQAGVQYMPCIVPIDQTGSLPIGAVPIGQLSPSQLPNAAMHISQMAANTPMTGGPQPLTNGVGPGQNSGGSGGPMGFQQRGSRPARGRSPQTRGRAGPQQPPFQQQPPFPGQMPFQQGPPAQPQEDRDWTTVRKFLPEGEERPKPRPQQSNADDSPTKREDGSPTRRMNAQQLNFDGSEGGPGGPRDNSKEPWRSSGKEAWRQPERQASAARKASTDRRFSPVRETSPGRRTTLPGVASERRTSAERRTSTERRNSAERRTSAERRASAERRTSVGAKEARTLGSMRLDCDNWQTQQAQASSQWRHPLPNGVTAQVTLVADEQALNHTVHRLSFQGPSSLTAVDIQGVNLRAAAGRLCLLQVAFWDTGGLQCILFDIMQLGESVGALSYFMENANAPKFVYNVAQTAQVFAHKFGITVAGVIDVGTAYQQVSDGTPLNNLMDYFEWCGTGVSNQRQDFQKMERDGQLWAVRPMTRHTLTFAVQNICMLHGTYPQICKTLCSYYGHTALETVANLSFQVVQVAADAGWHCRKAGLWIGEQTGGKPQQDPDMDDWLAKRFGKGPSAAQRRTSPHQPDLPPTAVRADDSPRTASWRAAVAVLAAPSRDARQRSGSPTLESWLARRSQVKAGIQEKQSKRATSMPAPRTQHQEEKQAQPNDNSAYSLFGMRDFITKGSNWADTNDDGDEDEIFEQLNQQERMRLAETS